MIFEGILEGIVTGEPITHVSGGGNMSVSTYIIFSVKLNEPIEGLPEEFVVNSPVIYIRKGDQIELTIKFFEFYPKNEKPFIRGEVKKVLNKSLSNF